MSTPAIALWPSPDNAWARPRAASVAVTLLGSRIVLIDGHHGPLLDELPGGLSVWHRDELLAQARQLGWRLESQEPIGGNEIRLHFARARRRRLSRAA